MRELQYTPDQINRMTIPLMECVVSSKPPSGRKLQSMDDYREVSEEEAENERDWMGR